MDSRGCAVGEIVLLPLSIFSARPFCHCGRIPDIEQLKSRWQYIFHLLLQRLCTVVSWFRFRGARVGLSTKVGTGGRASHLVAGRGRGQDLAPCLRIL